MCSVKKLRAYLFLTSVACAVAPVTVWAQGDAASQGAEAETNSENEIIVTGTALRLAASASKADIDPLENSMAISTVSRDALDEQAAMRLGDALNGVAGVSRNALYGFFDGFTIRGFSATFGATYLDGLLDNNGMASSEISLLERIEVVKGPASGLFGQGPLSGIVNMVSKRPQDDNFLDMKLTGGSYKLIDGQIDANAVLNKDASLLGRINLLFRDQDFFVDASGQRRLSIAPSITWKPGVDSSLTVIGRYLKDKINPYSPTTAYGTVLPNPNGKIRRSLSINDTKYPAVQRNDFWSVGYVFDHKFNETIGVHQSLRYLDAHNTWDNWLFVTNTSADYKTVGRFYYGPFDENGKFFRVDTNFSLKFGTGPIEHYVLAGYDYGYSKIGNTNLFDPGPYPMDLYNPIAGTVQKPNPAIKPNSSLNHSRQHGYYIQDHITFADILTITLGGRWDKVISRSKSNGVASPEVSSTAFSPRAGFTVALGASASFYANYAKSFSPQATSKGEDGKPLPPENGINYEAGFKVGRADGSLHGMATIFQLTRTNVAQSHPTIPNVSILVGEQRTRGFEFEAGWKPFAGLSLTTAYSFLNAKITKDVRLPIGARLASIPRHIFDLRARYTIQSGALTNFGFGAGVHYEGKRPASNSTPIDPRSKLPFVLKSYAIVDAALYYTYGDWSFQANIKNLLDKHYFPQASLTRVTVGEPRSFVISASRRF